MTVDKIDICLNSGTLTENIKEIIITNTKVMRAGVFNGKRKPSDELEKSVPRWLGKEIVIENTKEIGDHPASKITTSNTVIVGHLENPSWNSIEQCIMADAHFELDKTPGWLQDSLRKREVKGVSAAYFCSFLNENGELDGQKYDAIETDFVPNNLAIVKNPACKPPLCGLNVNSADTIYINIRNGVYDPKNIDAIEGSVRLMFPKGTFDESLPFTEITIEDPIQYKNLGYSIINSIKDFMNKKEVNTMSEIETVTKDKYDAVVVQLNTSLEQIKTNAEVMKTKEQEIATKDLEIARLNSELTISNEKLSTIENEAKKAKFLAQFPEVNREKAEKELLGIFMEKPSELVMNAAKIAELMIAPGSQKVDSKGKEFVPDVNDDEFAVSADYVAENMGLKKKT